MNLPLSHRTWQHCRNTLSYRNYTFFFRTFCIPLTRRNFPRLSNGLDAQNSWQTSQKCLLKTENAYIKSAFFRQSDILYFPAQNGTEKIDAFRDWWLSGQAFSSMIEYNLQKYFNIIFLFLFHTVHQLLWWLLQQQWEQWFVVVVRKHQQNLFVVISQDEVAFQNRCQTTTMYLMLVNENDFNILSSRWRSMASLVVAENQY